MEETYFPYKARGDVFIHETGEGRRGLKEKGGGIYIHGTGEGKMAGKEGKEVFVRSTSGQDHC